MAIERVSNIPAIEVASGVISPIDISDPALIKRECLESLVGMMRAAKGDTKTLGVVREILDRLEGKPIARTEASVDVRSVSVEVRAVELADDQLNRLLKAARERVKG